MHQLQCELLGLPISLILISDGTIALVKLRPFNTIFDMNNEVVITEEFLLVNNEKFLYNVQVELTEGLKEYLRWLELECPW